MIKLNGYKLSQKTAKLLSLRFKTKLIKWHRNTKDYITIKQNIVSFKILIKNL